MRPGEFMRRPLVEQVLWVERASLVAAQLRSAWISAVLTATDCDEVEAAWSAYQKQRRRAARMDKAIRARSRS